MGVRFAPFFANASTYISSSQTLQNTKIIKLEKDHDKYYILMKLIYSVPFWYENRTFDAPLFSIIGYGSGKNMKDAISDARVDISSQISSNISSSTEIITKSTNDKLQTKLLCLPPIY